MDENIEWVFMETSFGEKRWKDFGKKHWKGRRDLKNYVGILEKKFGEEC